MKFLAIIAMIVAVMLVFAGCGCQDKTGNDQNNNTTNQNTSSNTGKSDDSKSDTKTSNSDFEPTISLEQRKAVKAEDFIQGKNFDLTGYAEALGFTRLDDPDGGVIYAIKNGNTKCFFTYDENQIITWFDCGDGYVYQTSPEGCPAQPEDYTVLSRGQSDRKISKSGLDKITSFMLHIATTNELKMSYLPGFSSVIKLASSASYYPNGLIKVREIKDVVEETISCK